MSPLSSRVLRFRPLCYAAHSLLSSNTLLINVSMPRNALKTSISKALCVALIVTVSPSLNSPDGGPPPVLLAALPCFPLIP